MSGQLLFADEFDGFDAYSKTDKWRTAYHWGAATVINGEKAYYVDTENAGTIGPAGSVNPFSVSGGVLTITSAPAAGALPTGQPYTSGVLSSMGSFERQYGYYEIRADLPGGQGFWPAFWLMPADKASPPELDIMEFSSKRPNEYVTTTHSTAGGSYSMAQKFTYGLPDLSAGFHTYAVDWQADRITWYFDGQEVYATATPADFHKPMYMLVNQAAGGGGWIGPPDGSTQRFDVDYVRVYDSNPAGTAAPPPAPTPTPPPTPDPSPPQSPPGEQPATTGPLAGRGGLDTLVGGSGADWATLGEGGGTCHVSAVETLIGGSGADRVNLGEGGNRIILAAVETLVGGSAGDWVNLGDRGNTLVLAAVETLIGGSGGDWISLGDRGGTLILAAVETLIGGGGADWVNLGDRGNSMVLTALETLIGGSGSDAIRLGDRGNTLVLTAVETLAGGSGQDRVRLGDRGNTLAVSGVETLVGGDRRDDVTAAGAIRFQGGGGGDRLVLQTGANADTVAFGTVADGGDTIENFQSGTDRIAIAEALRTAVDRNGDGLLAAARRAGGTADPRSDELVELSTPVASLADDGFAAFRAALGAMGSDGTARHTLVLASDGLNGGLYAVSDADGTVTAGEVRLLGLFAGARPSVSDILLG